MENLEENFMKEPLCLDTDVCIDYLRDREPGSSYFLKAVESHQCLVSAITAYELLFGAKLMKSFQNIDGFLNGFIILPFDSEVARKAAEIHAELRNERKEIGLPDIFIAATCLVKNLPLLTGNVKHYSRIKKLKLIV